MFPENHSAPPHSAHAPGVIHVVHGESNTRASDTSYSVGTTLLFLVENVPEGDQSGVRAIANALMTPDP
jgi:hypothetical protein